MIWNWFVQRARKNPEATALIDDTDSITYAELALRAERIAESLPQATGPRPWRVLIQNADPTSLIIDMLACWKRGFSVLVLRDSMTPEQVVEISSWLKPIAILDGATRTFNFSDTSSATPLEKRDEALVICTSGTTGRPKLVALPAESVCINAEVIAKALTLRPDDRIAVNTPLGYMYALMGGCMASLAAGATCRLFKPTELLTQVQAAIRRENLTVVQGPPSLFRLFLAYWNNEPFPIVRVVTTGGEPLTTEVRTGITRAFPNAHKLFLYGMTEAGPRISHLDFTEGGGEDSRIGTPYEHIEWRLDKVDESEAGRLVLRGPGMFLGYIAADGSYEGVDDNGFFHSNDLLSQGPSGELHFRGRIDRIFRSGGRLVNPEAVERVLCSHSSIIDATCFPESHPLLGLVPVAEVIVRAGEPFDPTTLKKFCTMRIEPHAIPRRIAQVRISRLAESGKSARAS